MPSALPPACPRQQNSESVRWPVVDGAESPPEPRRTEVSDHLSGWLLPDEAQPRSVSLSESDCSGKLGSFRRPLALFMRGSRTAVAVAPYGWEGAAGMELWELDNGELQLIDFEPSM